MKCPNDGATLTMSERSGVEIDYCPECRGVWLDRGELDKILDRAVSENPAAPPAPAPAPSYDQQRGYQQPQQGYHSGGYQQGYKKKRKEHWLSEIFD
jgi:uncharacterized protein